MGFSFRKRTKGSGAWINFSASKKNGLGASVSLRPTKGVTINLKPGRTARTTISIAGTGLRWTGGGKSTRVRPPKEVKYKPLSAAAIRADHRERAAAHERDLEREEAEYEARGERTERIAEIEHRLRVIDQKLNDAAIYKKKCSANLENCFLKKILQKLSLEYYSSR